MQISKEDEEMYMNFGALGYKAKRIAIIVDEEEELIAREMKDPKSPISRLLKKGKAMAEYLIDLRLFELARENGDVKALEALEKRKQLGR